MHSRTRELITGSCANIGVTNSEVSNFQINRILAEHRFFIDDYGMRLASSGLTQSTIRYYMWDERQFLEWFESLPVISASVVGEIAADYYEYLLRPAHQLRPNSIGRHSPSTINRKLHSIRRFFDYAVDEGILPTNPFRESRPNISRQPSRTQLYPILPVETIRELLSSCDISQPIGVRDRALLIFIAGIGLRVGETHLLNLTDVNLIDMSLKVNSGNNLLRIAPLSEEFNPSLRRWLRVRSLHSRSSDALFISLHHSTGRGDPGKRLGKRGIRSIVDRRFEMIGAKKPGVSCEVLRRSAIVHLLKNGAAWENVRSTFGLNPRTMRAYEKYVSEIL